jgi:transposase
MDSCPSNLPIDGASFRRVEVLSGTPRRRRWSAEEKAAVVTASLAPGAVRRQVALRHGLHPNQLYAWRRELASVDFTGTGANPGFVPVAVARSPASARVGCGARTGTGPAVEIALGGAVVRVAPGVGMQPSAEGRLAVSRLIGLGRHQCKRRCLHRCKRRRDGEVRVIQRPGAAATLER